ncbi:MAG TPA: hypothetical protein VGM19_08130 [Armatimonadota bacterium]
MSSDLPQTGIGHFGWGRWLALYSAASFLMLGIDAAMNHHQIIYENRWSYTPLILAPLAVLVSLMGVFSARWRWQAWIIGLLALIVGGAGVVFHNLPTIMERGDVSLWQSLLNAPRPVLAPASFAATGVLLLLISWGEGRQRRPGPTEKE